VADSNRLGDNRGQEIEMAKVPRYIVERSADQVKTAFQGILKLCKEHNITHVTLVAPQKGNWDSTIVARFLGEPVAKSLMKGQSITLTQGVSMTLESAQTFRAGVSHGLLVGTHLSPKDMNKLDDSWDAQAILYLPWTDTDDREWRTTWQPKSIGINTQNNPSATFTSAVEDALQRLTQTINLGTGLAHPSDKKHAERMFEKLRADGHSFDPDEIRRWAQRNSWSSDAAADLAAVARKKR
jgi:hypothetical protein